jgi:hypothetical protein
VQVKRRLRKSVLIRMRDELHGVTERNQSETAGEDLLMARSHTLHGSASRLLLVGLLITATAAIAASGAHAETPRIVVVGEVSGAANAVTGLLQKLELVDETGHWSGGDAVLVQTGDLVDRGEHVRGALDLFIRLQEEAAGAGGRVVVLMGNHEILNILGEFQGVDYAAYQHFAGPDAELQQQRAWEAVAEWRGRRAEATAGDFSADETAKAEWLAVHPPGWVEYAMSMRPEGVYGRWLRTLPVAFELDGVLFAHAGFSPEMRGLQVAEVNRRAAEEIGSFDAYRARMAADGLCLPFSSARELVDVIAKEIAYLNALDGARQRRAKGRLEAAAELHPLTEMGGWTVLSETGPLFFKGATAWDDSDRGAEMAAILDGAGARRMVVGHASGPDKHIHARFGGRVVIASTELSDDPWGTNRPAALEIVDGQTFVVTPSSRAPLPDGA